MDAPRHPRRWRFGAVELRPDERRLLRDGAPLKIGGRAFDLLLALVERRDRVVPKAELLACVWPRLVVEENNLHVHVLALRKLLGPGVIATVPGRGYRFTAVLDGAIDAEMPAPAPPMLPAQTVAAPIGRDDDATALDALVRQYRLVTLAGAGGVGKTTLARHLLPSWRTAFADGVSWVDLSPVSSAEGVAEAVAAAAQLTLPRSARHAALAEALAPLQRLIVIDSAEHRLDEVAALAAELQASDGRLHLLMTSEAPLRIGGERVHRLEPLALAEPGSSVAAAARCAAVRLFVERVRAGDRHFALDAHNVAAVVSLTRRLDGLPLAIEMAAARVPALTPRQLDEALGERFRVLTVGDRNAPPRQRTLHAALQWTHALLGAAEQAVFRRLGAFVGSFSLGAAQRVGSDDAVDEWQVLDVLATLVDRTLVVPLPGETPRYRLLDTPRAFALQQLDASGEGRAVRRRHLEHFVARFGAAHEDHLHERQPVRRLREELQHDADDGWAAWEHALANDPDAAVALAPGLAHALALHHGRRFEVWRRSAALVHDSLPPPLRSRWLLGAATFWSAISPARSRPSAREAAALFRAEGHAVGEYRALAIVAYVAPGAPAEPDAEAAWQRLLELEDPSWPAGLRYLRHQAQVSRLLDRGAFDEARRACDAAAALLARGGREGRMRHEITRVYVELAAGDVEAVLRRGEAVLPRLPDAQRRVASSGIELMMMAAWLLRGTPDPARALAPAVWAATSRFDYQGPAGDVFALLAAAEGRPRAAALLAGYAEAGYARRQVTQLPPLREIADRAWRQALAALGEAAARRLRERGARLADDAVPAVAFAGADIDDPAA